jgi:Cu+-exporting ATPase
MPEDAILKETDLEIEGMTCASCVARVTRSLTSVPGVRAATVNLVTNRARVEHDGSADIGALTSAVANAGYAARPAAAVSLTGKPSEHHHHAGPSNLLLMLGVALFVPQIVLGMTPISFLGKDWVMLALALPVWLLTGWEFHRSALTALRHGAANMDTLVSLGSTAAIAYSIFATVAGMPAFYETASGIVVLVSVGKYLEATARARTGDAIRGLMMLAPSHALLKLEDGSTREVDVETLRPQDIVVVRPGDPIPVDGVVVAGAGSLDSSMVTGESMPREIEPGSEVIGGTINLDAALDVRVTATGAGTALAKIVGIVQDAQGSRAPAQALADKIAGVFVPIILVVSLLTLTGWMLAGRDWVEGLTAAIAALVVACPCAMGLATPAAVMVGIGTAAKRGILFKDAESLERIGGVSKVVFDKTGTLTTGKPAVTGITAFGERSQSSVLATAAAVEQHSSHPIASAILAYAREHDVPVAAAADSKAVRGFGAQASVGGHMALVGTARFLQGGGVALDGQGSADASRIYVAEDGKAIGAIDVTDELRPSAAAAVKGVRELGAVVALVSGDAPEAVNRAAAALDISVFRARALPDEKAAFVRELQSRGDSVAFVGDGINDAPALAVADVGVAMGGGTEIAIAAAGAAVISNDPAAVATAMRISRATSKTIRQNLFWAYAYNVVLVPLAVFGFIHPILAAGAMGLSSVCVVTNSLLLARRA